MITEVFEKRQAEVMSYEKPKVDVRLIERKTNARTYRGFLTGCIAKARKDKNAELEILFNELLAKFNTYYPDKIVRIEIIQGWKDYGEAHPDIWKGVDNNFSIKVWHNQGFEIKEVKKEALNRIIAVLRGLKAQETISCYEMAFRLGYGDNPKSAWKNLWANRMNEYFPYYYFPILVLREMKCIQHLGKGMLQKL